jgi:RNA-directed DNA polymerase
MDPNSSFLLNVARYGTNLRVFGDFDKILKLPRAEIQALAENPLYDDFQMPKRDGSFRLIEAPKPNLKAIQRRIQMVLQAVYWRYKSPAAYGFIINATDDVSPRNIYTHAERHLGCKYLLNLDCEDFFHQFTTEKVMHVFLQAPFSMDEYCARLLAKLCTYKGRLPMGAPTSPVITNLACLLFDRRMLQISDLNGWTYTRFADDCSFSTTNKPILPDEINFIKGLFLSEDLPINTEKEKYMQPGERMIITGLQIDSGEVALPDEFVRDLKHHLHRLRNVKEVAYSMAAPRVHWLERYEQSIRGQLNFAEQALGADDPLFQKLWRMYEGATSQPDRVYGAWSWLSFGY